MSAIYRLISLVFLSGVLLTDNTFGQQSLRKIEFGSVATQKKDRFVLNYRSIKSAINSDEESSVAVLIFIDSSNVLLSGESLNIELKSLEEDLRKAELSDNCRVFVILGERPRIGNNYFEFLNSDYVVSDYPIYILHSNGIPNWRFDAFSKFEYQKEEVDEMKIIRYRLEKGSCGKNNFLKPLHHEIFDLAKSIAATKASPEKNFDLIELKSTLQELQKDLLDLKQTSKRIEEKISRTETRIFAFESDYKFSSNVVSRSLRMYYHNDVHSSNFLFLGFGASVFQSDTHLNFLDYSEGASTFCLSEIIEHNNTRYNSICAGYKRMKDLGDSPWEIHFSTAAHFNRIVSSTFQWTSGTMDIRGKVDGIGDEIINVPDLGYRDGISLVGVQGQSNIKRFFPSASIDVAFHYNLEKVDFFSGVGYTYSSLLKPVNPDALVSDGTHFNSLISTTNPIAIRTPYFSLGASLNF